MDPALEQRERHVDRREEQDEEYRHLHHRSRLHRAQAHRDAGRPQDACGVDQDRERVQPEQNRRSADVHTGDQRDCSQHRRGQHPARERGKRIAEHDAALVRRREHEPPREPALEVASDAEAGEDTATAAD